MQYTTLELERRDDGVSIVTLARPDRHNAFDSTLIAEITHVFEAVSDDTTTRAVLLRGAGKSFSAGADIEWMRAQGEASKDDNVRGAREMERAFRAIYECKKPVVARIHGAALGGGTGLTAAADIAIASRSTVFGFTEVRLGIIPAVISPFVIEKVGLAKAKALFLLGTRFRGEEAERIGLVFRAVPDDDLDREIDGALQALAMGGRHALQAAKKLCHATRNNDPAAVSDQTTSAIAEIRQSEEAREGLAAFLEKRKPSWIVESGRGDEDGRR